MITLPNAEGKTYAVLGLGKSGLSVAASLRASKARAVVWDDNPDARAEAARAGYEVVDLMQADLSGFHALVLSPGIPHTHPAPHPVVTRVRSWRGGVPLPLREGLGEGASHNPNIAFGGSPPPLAAPSRGEDSSALFVEAVSP